MAQLVAQTTCNRQVVGSNPTTGSVEPATLDVTVVVPYYNPGASLRTTIDDTVAILAKSGMSFEVITVSDGSTDGSEATLEGVPEDLVRRVTLERNYGKGQALHVGLDHGRGRYLGFIDADGDISPEFLSSFVTLMQSYDPDLIIGSKRHPSSEVVYPPLRRVYSWGYQQLIRVLFDLEVQDTQVGIKLINRRVIEVVLPLLVEDRFAFDLELIVVARHLGYGNFIEAPVRIEERFSSTISPRAVLGMLLDTLRVFVRLRLRHAYGPARPPRTAPD